MTSTIPLRAKRGLVGPSLVLLSLGLMIVTRGLLLLCFSVMLLVSCATASQPRQELVFSGVTQRDMGEIEALVALRSDILKPVIRATLLSTGRVKVVGGRDLHVGDTFDTFTVAKRHGTWGVASTVVRDSIVVTAD